MIINEPDKWIYVRPSRTGSTSLSHHIREKCDVTYASKLEYRRIAKKGPSVKHLGPLNIFPHSTLKDIKNNVRISDYSIYGIVREPVDRFVSCVYFSFYMSHGEKFNGNINTQILKYLNKNINDIPFKPQIDYFMVNDKVYDSNLYPYEKINDLSVLLTGTSLEYKYWGNIRNSYDKIDKSLKEEIVSVYSKDKELYEKTKERHS